MVGLTMVVFVVVDIGDDGVGHGGAGVSLDTMVVQVVEMVVVGMGSVVMMVEAVTMVVEKVMVVVVVGVGMVVMVTGGGGGGRRGGGEGRVGPDCSLDSFQINCSMFFDFSCHLCGQWLSTEATSRTKGKGRKDSQLALPTGFTHLNSLCKFYICILGVLFFLQYLWSRKKVGIREVLFG